MISAKADTLIFQDVEAVFRFVALEFPKITRAGHRKSVRLKHLTPAQYNPAIRVRQMCRPWTEN